MHHQTNAEATVIEPLIYSLIFISALSLGVHGNMDRNGIGNAANLKPSGPIAALWLLLVPINLVSFFGTVAILIWSMWKLSVVYTLIVAASALVALILIGFPMHRTIYPWLRGDGLEDRYPIAAGLNILLKLISVSAVVIVATNFWGQ